MADSQQPVDQQVTTPTIDTQQVTSKTPATKQKNPKRVVAGKAIAERTRIAREAQRKAIIEAESIIAKNKEKPADPPCVDDTPSVAPEPTKNILTTTQWLSVISIIVSLVGIYYKREEIKNVFAKKATPSRAPHHHLFCREQVKSHRWIEDFICFL